MDKDKLGSHDPDSTKVKASPHGPGDLDLERDRHLLADAKGAVA